MSPITDDLRPLDEQDFGAGVEPHAACCTSIATACGGFGSEAVAGYVRTPGDAGYEPLAIDVLRVRDGVVTEIVTIDGAVFERFDLPATR